MQDRIERRIGADVPLVDSRAMYEELIAIADEEGNLVPPRGTASRARISAIGNALNGEGGLELMLRVHTDVALVVGSDLARELEMAWNGIGEWWS